MNVGVMPNWLRPSMVDITIDVITPASNIDLMKLDDAKLVLGISSSDSTQDDLLQMLITQNSAVIAEECNRIFAKEEITETWRCIEDIVCPPGKSRIFLTHYPVKKSDIQNVQLSDGSYLTTNDYYLEERSGKLTIHNAVSDVAVTYTGGYVLPDESPLPLQQALGLLVQKGKLAQQQAASGSAQASGIRMISHKGSRVMYYAPKDMVAKSSGTSGTGGASVTTVDSTVKALLYNYMRMYV
jgi:hypothetical protein